MVAFDKDITWIEQTSDGVDLSGNLPGSTPVDSVPHYRAYQSDADAGRFDWGYENRYPIPAGEENREVFYKLQELHVHSTAAFDLLVYLSDGTTDVLVIDSNALVGAPIEDIVVTEDDLPTLSPGQYLKCTTSGAAADI